MFFWNRWRFPINYRYSPEEREACWSAGHSAAADVFGVKHFKYHMCSLQAIWWFSGFRLPLSNHPHSMGHMSEIRSLKFGSLNWEGCSPPQKIASPNLRKLVGDWWLPWVFPKIMGFPQIIHFNRVFHYKPSILWYPYFWKHPYL